MTKIINRQLFFRNARLFVIPLSLIFFGDSCKRHGFGSVEGNVIDEYTNEPVVNAEVKICRSYHGSDCDFLKQTTTDQTGHFKIKYYNNRNSFYTLTAKSGDSFSEAGIDLTNNRKSECTIKLPMKAFVKVKTTNNLSFSVRVSISTSDQSASIFTQVINAGQTKVLDNVFNIEVGHTTTLYFIVRDNSNNFLLNTDTTILMTKKLDTLLYTVNF